MRAIRARELPYLSDRSARSEPAAARRNGQGLHLAPAACTVRAPPTLPAPSRRRIGRGRLASVRLWSWQGLELEPAKAAAKCPAAGAVAVIQRAPCARAWLRRRVPRSGGPSAAARQARPPSAFCERPIGAIPTPTHLVGTRGGGPLQATRGIAHRPNDRFTLPCAGPRAVAPGACGQAPGPVRRGPGVVEQQPAPGSAPLSACRHGRRHLRAALPGACRIGCFASAPAPRRNRPSAGRACPDAARCPAGVPNLDRHVRSLVHQDAHRHARSLPVVRRNLVEPKALPSNLLETATSVHQLDHLGSSAPTVAHAQLPTARVSGASPRPGAPRQSHQAAASGGLLPSEAENGDHCRR